MLNSLLRCRASVNILRSGVHTSMALNLDIHYALAVKSDVMLHTGWKTILAVWITMHYAGHSRSQRSFPLKRSVGNQIVGLQD